MIYTNSITGVNVYDIEQGSEEWLWHRAGVITASRAHDIIKTGKAKGSYSESRKAYMLELIAQVCTGQVPEQSSFKQAEWGHENEPLARERAMYLSISRRSNSRRRARTESRRE